MYNKTRFPATILAAVILCLSSFPATAFAQITDRSDAVWSIVVPKATAVDLVDMGQVQVNDIKDSVVIAYLVNTGPADIRINGITVAPPFKCLSGTQSFVILKGDSAKVEFLFTPATTGVVTRAVTVFTQVDTLTKTIRGEGVEPQIEVTTTLVDFGQVKVGLTKQIITSVICNKGSGMLSISGITKLGPDKEQFFILSDSGAFTLAPGKCDTISLMFKPTQAGRTSGRLGFYYSGAGSPAIVNLFGEGLGVQGFATLGVDTIRAKAGDLVEVPVYLRNALDVDLTGATGFQTELSFNSTLLSPFGSTPKDGTTANGRRSILLTNLPVKADAQGILTKLQFIAMLGDAEGTPLTLQNSYAVGGKVAVTEAPGYFELIDVCREGGTRLFTAAGHVNLFQNRPNPFNAMTVIDYEVIENGATRLIVMDMYGRIVATLVDAVILPGRYAVSFDAATLPSGTYITVLQTPTNRMLRLMEVVK
jgi:hypothetical protein